MLAYGFEFRGLAARPQLSELPALVWPTVDLVVEDGPAPRRTAVTWTPSASVLTSGGDLTIRVERSPLRATIVAPRPVPPAEIEHPLLSFVAAAGARWMGRSAFHAASVVLRGRAWLVLGHPESGKSTLAAGLHARGHAVLGDDLSVLEGHTALRGVRSADLREPAARALQAGVAPSTGAARRRWRTSLGKAPLEVPLGGLISLGWSDAISTTALPVGERLATLAAHEWMMEGPTQPDSFLDLLDVPMVRLCRPRSWVDFERVLGGLRAGGVSVSRR